MYKSYWGMEYNPFERNTDKSCFNSNDFDGLTSRLKYLVNTKGIGLFTGASGSGKTYAIKKFIDTLNPSLYKVIYTSHSTVTVLDFYKSIAYGLDIEPAFRKVDLFRQIQERITDLSKNRKITPIIILDEAQYLKTAILNDLKLLLNFEMDSKNYAVLILIGQPILNNILIKQVHEAIVQRIIITYMMFGLTKDEVKTYLDMSFKNCGVSCTIIDSNSIEAIFSCCNGSIRRLNSIVDRCLVIAYKEKCKTIDCETVMKAQVELSLA